MSWFGSIYDEELPHRAKSVYMYLKDRSDGNGESWYGINTIAADLKLSRSTVKRALHDLVDAKLVEKHPRYRENGSYSSNLYRITAQ
ncbi:MAG: helix-turn-helix domain-containing protein [Synergistaceae bacterium]|jgi:DNA-binding MarR family transcriptional regulator|nr:helix-turn-helix domain-containing protein [Proteiniphilum sp.]MDD3963125.1 helix-turn-helix domain-containing protein [Synergistaceae bacterium]